MDMRRTVVLSASAALAVLLLGVAALLWAQQAQAQEPCNFDFCVDKTADKSTVRVGEQITFTITERCFGIEGVACGNPNSLVDTLPSGLTDVTVEDSDPTIQCTTSGNTVTCPGGRVFTPAQPFTLTIVATTTECGPFTNTAGNSISTGTATFTVEGCPTLPTTKEECKKGGWKKLGYADQGTCITAFNESRPHSR
jgi:uncharacterized repeat protein (TIGR01451 family)